ncbi:Serine/threonine-protein kinase PrkC [Pseudobythopirellula maris]|uniref:Serine/threonine-protein kinase PrkC n=1 Tax=Pseudobythopirellula maris TaxID=2527991 RepID=A0A5C5ZRI9_9BACT|nr:serine/threonine-protein kinase [Pseudobythopirellula maris]TWT90124.1 Serine/threonine-protein kinase PrkC [Pseudobythopirellula maris]
MTSPSRPYVDHSLSGSLAGAQQEELAEALEQYVAALERGEQPAMDDIAAAHPALAEVLPEYLEGVRQIHEAMAAHADDSSALTSHGGNSLSGPSLIDNNGGDSSASASEPAKKRRRQIGDYELLREVGRGGMGVVHEALQLSLNRRVAVKVLPFSAVLDERQISRFRTEAQAAAGLHHTNIVPVFAVGQERGVYFYAMQFIEGMSLGQAIEELRADRLDKDAASPRPTAAPKDGSTIDFRAGLASTLGDARETQRFRTVAELGVQAAEALEHAHRYGVVHRDVKPTNLLLDRAGKLWVTDFGLARVQSELSVTLPGDVIGTLRYMSPEQARGRGDLVDGRTDVYALGATLYELLTLCPAHAFDDTAAGARALAERIGSSPPVAPRRLNQAIPIDLETIILKAMETSRDDRYTTAQALADDLRRFLDGKPTVARRPGLVERSAKWLARRRGVAAAAAAALFVTAAVSAASAVWVGAHARRTADALAQSEANLARAETHYRQARLVVDHFGADLADRLAEIPGAERLHQRLLGDTLGYYQAFLETEGPDGALRDDLATTHYKSGAVAERLGDPAAARDCYQQAVEAWRGALPLTSDLVASDAALQAAQTKSDNSSNDLLGLMALGNLARIEGNLGDHDTSGRRFGAAISLGRRLLREEPDSVARMSLMAETLANHGVMLTRSGRNTDGAKRLREAIGLLERVAALEPERAEHARDLAVAENNLSDALRRSSPQEALEASERAATTLQRLCERWPGDSTYRGDLAMSLNNLAALHGAAGDWPAAARGYGRAAQTLQALVRENPLLPRSRRELAIALGNLALASSQAGDEQASDAAFEAANETLAGLTADFPKTPTYRDAQAALWNNRGVALRSAGRLDAAVEAFAEAVTTLEENSAPGPPGPNRLAMLGKQYRNYAETLDLAGRREELSAVESKIAALGADADDATVLQGETPEKEL